MKVMMRPAIKPFDGARSDQSQNQVRLGQRRGEIAFVEAARLVVDESNAAADHGGNENRERNRARQQVLDVLDVGIDLDCLNRDAWRAGDWG